MCLILDANNYSNFLDRGNADMEPIRKWLGREGKLAYSPTKKFEGELTPKIKDQFAIYREAGKMKIVDKEKVQNEQNKLSGLRSNDSHIIALAKVADIRLLVSSDHALHEDFKDVIMHGKIYQNKSHKNLLTNFLCP